MNANSDKRKRFKASNGVVLELGGYPASESAAKVQRNPELLISARKEADLAGFDVSLEAQRKHALRKNSRGSAKVDLVRADTIRPEATRWLWNGWLAAGKLHLIGGQPGTGKTTIALALAATITKGGRWPDGSLAEEGDVVVWSGEDDAADTIVPRLHAAGADLSHVHIVQGVREGGERHSFDPVRDIEILKAALVERSNVRLLVIDPIVSAVGGDSHKNAEVRRSLQPLVDLALLHESALLGITHFTKGTAGREPIERITGSLAFGALARLVLVAARSDSAEGKPEVRFLARAKSNIGADGGGFVYHLDQRELTDYPGIFASTVVWGQALDGSAKELLAQAETPADCQALDAAGFLRELLSEGPRSAKDIFLEAEISGFSKHTMHRAKRKIGVVATKRGMAGGWCWRLPGTPLVAEAGPEAGAEDNEDIE